MADWNYQEMQKRLDESIKKDQARQKVIRAKREEKKRAKEQVENFQPSMLADNTPNYEQECEGLLFCTFCGKTSPCRELNTKSIREKVDMIPRGNQSTGSGRGKKKSTGFKYLSVDMLTTSKQLAVIQEARVEDDNFKPDGTQMVSVKLKFKGEYILWTLRPSNPNLEVLGDAFGDDESQWSGKEIHLFVEEDNFNGKKWIRSEAIGGDHEDDESDESDESEEKEPATVKEKLAKKGKK